VDATVELLVGVVLLVVGAVGATTTQRRFELTGRATWAPVALVPFGVLVGAGAALVRGYDLVAAMLVGAIVVPLVGVVGRMIEVRRHRRDRDRG
jgi:hypothetical protein